MTWFMPRALITPNRNVGNYQSSGTTNIYVQNNYDGYGGLWNGYFSRTSGMNYGVPVMTDPIYSMPSCNYGIPGWLQKSFENNMLFSFVQGMFGGGGGCGC